MSASDWSFQVQALAAPTGQQATATPAAVGTQGIRISAINSPGNLASEAAAVVNDSDLAMNLQGWKLEQEGGAAYTIGNVLLFPGSGVLIYSGAGIDTSVALYWNQPAAVWQAGAVARLLNPRAAEVARFSGAVGTEDRAWQKNAAVGASARDGAAISAPRRTPKRTRISRSPAAAKPPEAKSAQGRNRKARRRARSRQRLGEEQKVIVTSEPEVAYVPPQDVFIYTYAAHPEMRDAYEFRPEHFSRVGRTLADYQIDLTKIFPGNTDALPLLATPMTKPDFDWSDWEDEGTEKSSEQRTSERRVPWRLWCPFVRCRIMSGKK